MKIYGVIMAGGGGTRFWPLSRQATPKQLLNLTGKDYMINEAISRLSQVTDCSDIFIVTNASQAEKMQEITDGKIRKDHILIEPCAKNTAACIGYAAVEIQKKYGDGIMVITPSDAYIRNDIAFAEVLKKAIAQAESFDSLVTIGITPTFPATGYGYIQYLTSEHFAKKVLQFKEKPDLQTATEYLLHGDYVWNSGMFIWKTEVVLHSFQTYLSDIYEGLLRIQQAMGTGESESVLQKEYRLMRSISIDYGIMEKSPDIYVVPGEFGWSDVGSWDMLDTLHPKDNDGNVTVGENIIIDSSNSVFYSTGRLIAAVGLENIVVVETSDSVLVCSKEKVQDVKKIVDLLKKENKKEYL